MQEKKLKNFIFTELLSGSRSVSQAMTSSPSAKEPVQSGYTRNMLYDTMRAFSSLHVRTKKVKMFTCSCIYWIKLNKHAYMR